MNNQAASQSTTGVKCEGILVENPQKYGDYSPDFMCDKCKRLYHEETSRLGQHCVFPSVPGGEQKHPFVESKANSWVCDTCGKMPSDSAHHNVAVDAGETPELLPCPFKHSVKQGSLADSYEPYSTDSLSEDSNWCVCCPVCKSATGYYNTEQEARRAWNTRAASASSERDELARAIAEAAIKVGIIDGTQPLTGPQLIMLCDDLATASSRDDIENKNAIIKALVELWDENHPDDPCGCLGASPDRKSPPPCELCVARTELDGLKLVHLSSNDRVARLEAQLQGPRNSQ